MPARMRTLSTLDVREWVTREVSDEHLLQALCARAEAIRAAGPAYRGVTFRASLQPRKGLQTLPASPPRPRKGLPTFRACRDSRRPSCPRGLTTPSLRSSRQPPSPSTGRGSPGGFGHYALGCCRPFPLWACRGLQDRGPFMYLTSV